MASHSGLTATHEAVGSRRYRTLSGRSTLVVTIGLWLAATGLVCLAFEALGAATAFIGIAVLLIRYA
jgi:hypothetical protein